MFHCSNCLRKVAAYRGHLPAQDDVDSNHSMDVHLCCSFLLQIAVSK